MCKYCEEHWIEEDKVYSVENLSERTESKNNYGYYTGIQSFIDLNEKELVIVACLDNKHIKPLLKYEGVSINYCPMCGKKLNN